MPSFFHKNDLSMKSRTTKISFLFALYFAAHFADACQPICDCPKLAFPYFDYKKLSLQTSDPIATGYLAIKISPDSVQLVAQASPRFNFMSAAYGCDCNVDGDKGDKYAPISMDVFADRDFNDTLPAGVSLRSIFYGQTLGDIVSMISEPYFRPEKFHYSDNYYSISTQEHPKYPGEPYHFQIQWVKSNGDTLVAQTDAVIF